jgi:Serine/threonine protein phosphatase
MSTNDPEPSDRANEAGTEEARRRAVLSQPLTIREFRPLSSSVKVAIAARSHRGAAQRFNDDHYLVVRVGRTQETLATSLSDADVPSRFEENGYAMLIADGLGEAGSGSVASRVALSTIAHCALDQGKWNVRIGPETVAEIRDRAQEYYDRADAEVFAKSLTGPLLNGIATSLTAAYSAGDNLFVVHVGHSRAYLFRRGLLTLLTRDHTLERHLASSKGPVAIERRAQDLGHSLTEAIGADGAAPVVDVEQFRLTNADAVLLCTNGLTDMISDAQIANVLAVPRQPGEQCDILTDLAKQQGGEDNVTVVLAQYQVPSS